MNVKKIGAILAGAVMIGSAVAAAWNPAEHKDFFVNPETGETGRRGVFAAGDIVTGNATVISAMAGGKKAARAIHKFLMEN